MDARDAMYSLCQRLNVAFSKVGVPEFLSLPHLHHLALLHSSQSCHTFVSSHQTLLALTDYATVQLD